MSTVADKTTTERDVVAELRDGMTIGFGGWGSRRKPMSVVREILRSDLQDLTIDRAYRISDEEMLLAIYDMVEHEGLVMGGSTGINVAGAIRLAKDLGPGHTVVTILCDHGQRYQSKIYNPDFLAERGLPVPKWMAGA